MKKHPIKKKSLAIVCAVCAVLAIAFGITAHILGGKLSSQQMAERWRGENELKFSQVSCYIPVDEKISLQQIYAFRTEIVKKLGEAAIEDQNVDTLFADAWSTTGRVNVASGLGKGEAAVIAVGGRFFDFHPIRLISGSYFNEDDLMKDRVLLDEELAWLLFGGTELDGMEMTINGKPFVVAGVIEREQDFASKKAYTAGMGLYMSYEAFSSLQSADSTASAQTEGGSAAQTNPDAGASCYEFVMAEPVDGYAKSLADEKFPIGHGEILENSDRYGFGRMLKLIGQFGSRSMQTLGVAYPYWENAARCIEDWYGLCLFLALFFAVLPLIMIIVNVVRYLKLGKDKLEDDVIPKLKDGAEEAIRVRQRRRWERKHGKHES